MPAKAVELRFEMVWEEDRIPFKGPRFAFAAGPMLAELIVEVLAAAGATE